MTALKNVFVLDLDPGDRRLERLKSLPGARSCEFHPVFEPGLLSGPNRPTGVELLREIEKRLSFFNGSVDACLALGGFPMNVVAALAAHDLDLPGPRPAALLKCEHRFWTLLELERALELHPELGIPPRFGRVPWDSPRPRRPVSLAPPVPCRLVESLSGPDLGAFFEEVDAPAEVLELGRGEVFAEERASGRPHRVDAISYDGELCLRHAADERFVPLLQRIDEFFGLGGSAFTVELVLRGHQAPGVTGVSARPYSDEVALDLALRRRPPAARVAA